MIINIGKCHVDWYEIDYDQRLYVCRQKDLTAPLGVVIGQCYYIGNDNGQSKYSFFEVKLSYVTDWARRNGIRSLINQTILQDFPAITTFGHTPLGYKFIKGKGYKKHPQLGWILTRPNKKTKNN
jgi:hypothetical protein